MNTLPSTYKSAKPAITSYLAHLAGEEGVEKIHFFLAQCTVKSYPILKSFGNVIRYSKKVAWVLSWKAEIT